jgi:hypothetical protein
LIDFELVTRVKVPKHKKYYFRLNINLWLSELQDKI